MDYHNPQNKKGKKELVMSRQTLNRIIYLGELPYNIDSYEIHEFIISKTGIKPETINVQRTKDNKAYAYVKFFSKEAAEKVRNEIHLSNLGDSIIRAETFIENNALKKAIESDGSNIFVKNLPQTITPKQLFDLAQTYGKIISIKLKQDKQGKSLGYGYVQYSSNEEASMAIECLNKITIQGKYILAEKFEKDRSKLDQNPQDNKSKVIYIDHIPSRITNDKELEKIFSVFGKIVMCSIVQSSGNNYHKIGFISFERSQDAERCVQEMNDKVLLPGEAPIQLKLSPSKDDLDKMNNSKQEILKSKYDKLNLIVKNLPKDLDDSELYDYFSKFGEINSAKISREEGKFKDILNEKGEVIDKEYVYESKGFGFVCFKRPECAEAALHALSNAKFTNGKLKDSKITVEYYQYERKTGEPKIKQKKKQYTYKEEDLSQNFDQRMNINNNNIYNNKNFPQNRMMNSNHLNTGPVNKLTGQQTNMMGPNNTLNVVQPRTFVNQNNNFYKHQQQQLAMEKPFITEMRKIINSQDPNKTDILGELIFYYLKSFISKYNLNSTELDDDTLSAKFTGIFYQLKEHRSYHNLQIGRNPSRNIKGDN